MKFLLIIISFACFGFANAQTISAPPFKRFGFQAGLNTANMNFNLGVPAPAGHIAAFWKTGISFGFLLRVPLAKDLFLQPEYAFNQRKGADKSISVDYDLDYLSMPVLLNYSISSRISLLAGPQLELLIDARSAGNGVSSNITHDVEERSIGLLAGLEFRVKKSLFLSARYLQGLNHIGIGQRSDVKEFKYEVVSVSAGIRF
ncbi:MAG: porin family protein [Bacteroidota bacterium]|nr:porin family protein [Bacteroidota bacterium]MDP4214106.1 porin family protein [Bacteroidota bacterium]MDP4251145.1 porin family protein [Bacteroidota bacterium]